MNREETVCKTKRGLYLKLTHTWWDYSKKGNLGNGGKVEDDAVWRYGLRSPAVLRGAEVLEPAPYIRGCVRANHPISTSQEFLTTACWSFQSARSVVSRLCGSFRLSAFFRWWWIHPPSVGWTAGRAGRYKWIKRKRRVCERKHALAHEGCLEKHNRSESPSNKKHYHHQTDKISIWWNLKYERGKKITNKTH